MRKRPRLAPDGARPRHLDADLLRDFAREALFERLARPDEARESAVHPGREVRAAGEQNLTASPDERHDRRRHSRIRGELARWAYAHALLAVRLGARATAAAELVRAVPVEELQRPAGESEVSVVEHAEERPQALPRQAGGALASLGHLATPPRRPPELPEIGRS